MDVQERYNPVQIPANATVQTSQGVVSVGGFLCFTSGTLTITKNVNGVVVVNAFPVTGGVYHPIPFYFGSGGLTVTTAGGASGVLGVS